MSRNTATNLGMDRRTRHTRTRLAQALMKLGVESGIDQLSISQLTADANVGRSTFYEHYANKQDFLCSSFDRLIADMDKLESIQNRERKELIPALRLLAHIADASEFAIEMTKSVQYAQMMATAEARLRTIAVNNLHQAHPNLQAHQLAEYTVYIAGGFIGLLKWWMERGLQQPVEQIHSTFTDLTNKILLMPRQMR